MSVTAVSDSPANPVSSPNEKLKRLIVEASDFLDVDVGDTLPRSEVIEQGIAHGYSEREVRALLAESSYSSSSETIRVPPRGDTFGELWSLPPANPSVPSSSAGGTTNTISSSGPSIETGPGAPNTSDQLVKIFQDWSKNKQEMRRKEYDNTDFQHSVEHAYSYKSELEKFVRAKDVERWFIGEYDKITAILVTYTKPRDSDESVVDHAQGIYSRRIKRKRRECIKATGYWDEYAGVSLLAPRDVAPNASDQTTHGHDVTLMPGFISSESFGPLRQEDGVDVSIQYARSEQVESPSAINRSDLEQSRGPTSSLAQEVGANLPVLTAIESFRDKVQADPSINSARYKATLDATDCPEYVERWCAHMSGGDDGDPSTNGVQRWTPLGRWREIADSMKDERDYGPDDSDGPQFDFDLAPDDSIDFNL